MKLLEFLLALSMCFMIPLNFISQNTQQYILAIPALFLIGAILIIRNKKLNVGLLVIISLIVFSFFITGFEFGISLGDFVPLFGILLIPIIIQIYGHRDPLFLFKYFVLIFSFYELAILFSVLKYNALFDLNKLFIIREEVSWAFPNYFAMLSVIKIFYLLYNA